MNMELMNSKKIMDVDKSHKLREWFVLVEMYRKI